MYKFLVIFTVVGVCYSSVGFQKYFKVCNTDAADSNECLVDAISEGITAMAGGIEELDLSPIDPFFQKILYIEYNLGLQIQTKVNLKRIMVTGLKDSTIVNTRVKADDDILRLEINLNTPLLNATGDYEAQGNFNTIQLMGFGDFNCIMRNVKTIWIMEGTPEEYNGETYVQIESFKVFPEIESMVTYLSNNNMDSKPLSDFALEFFNRNWQVIYKELLPIAQKEWNKIGVAIANKVLKNVPYRTAFPTGH